METLLGPWWVDKHKHKLSNSAVVTVLQRSPLLFSLQMQCGDVLWGGQSLQPGSTQLRTIDPSGRLAYTHGLVSLYL